MLLFFVSPARANDLEKQVRKVTLENGLTALLIKREGAPIFSAHVRVKVGNIEEPKGSSGLAHFFEHMAFKGTPEIGVRDYPAEEKILAEMHAVGTELAQRRRKGESEEELEPLAEKLHALEEKDQTLLVKNEFVQIYQRNGGDDVNATTSNDFTNYYVSLPASKMELWAHLESERLLRPVLREFYKERDVVAEERRMRYDNDPDGKLYEAFLSTAFDANPYPSGTVSPYGVNVIGIPSDIRNYTFEAAMDFRRKYYIPSRMVVTVAGNFDVDTAERLVREYFGKLPKKADTPLAFEPQKPDGSFPREKVITGRDEPRFYVGFHRPAFPHPDDEIFDVLENLLCDGRTSRLFSLLVSQKKLVSEVDCYATLPGARLDSLFAFYAVPLKSADSRVVRKEILDQVDLLKREPVKPEELEKVKNKISASLIWSLKENMGLASMLGYFESLTGDWKYIYRLQKRIGEIAPADVQRAAQTYFVPGREVTVYLEKE
ncbi:MAG: insulinase family protein [Deltaproteobacteria bacterium]|nr:insulinase family protein [Deltaproteobacteria bacterium]